MPNGNLIAGGLLLVAGVYTVIARYFRWKWFINHYKVRNTADALGEKGANLLYYVTGSVFIFIGMLIMFLGPGN